MSIFDPQDASLSELKISHGDTLVVTEGHLPPKVRHLFASLLSHWLCPSGPVVDAVNLKLSVESGNRQVIL